MSTSAYVDITPSEGVIKDSGYTVRVTLTDENGNPITGAAASLTLTFIPPLGTVITPVTGGSLTDEGSGVYSYTRIFDERGIWYGDWFYDGPGDMDRVGGWLLTVSRRRS